jgi:CheY-like chemotaxis protein
MVAPRIAHDPETPSTVLIVEDDADTRGLLSDLFRKRGFRVVTASHGGEAIDLLQRMENPAVVLVDLLMPGIVGHSVLEFLRGSPNLSSIPVAVITGSPELAPHGVSVFTKPIAFESLYAFVQHAIGAA